MACLMGWFNDRALPDANHRARMLMDDVRRKKPVVGLGDRAGLVIQDFEDYRILIGAVDPLRSLVKDVVIYRNQPGEFPVLIAAEQGEMAFSSDGGDMVLTLRDGEVHAADIRDQGRYVRTAFDREVIVLGDAGRRLVRTVNDARGDREMTVAQMRRQAEAYAADVRSARAAAGGAFDRLVRRAMLADAPARMDGPEEVRKRLAEARSELMVADNRQRTVNRYLVEIHKKYAIAVACVAFVLLGLPLGVAFRTGGAARSAAVSIGFFLLYWMFLIGGEKLADRGYLSPGISMWSANVLIGAAGLWLTWRELRR